MTEPKKETIATLDLTNIAKGAVPELFERALRSVIENLADTNTPWETKRSIKLEIIFQTVETRDVAACIVEVTSKLAGAKPEISTILIDHNRDGGELVAIPQDLLQRQMFPKQDPPANMVQMPEAKEK